MIVTDHSGIDYGRVQALAKVLVDTRSAARRAVGRRTEPVSAGR
jgi:hypothetical protein